MSETETHIQTEPAAHDHELEVLEDDQTVPPRPEEQIADATSVADGSAASDDERPASR